MTLFFLILLAVSTGIFFYQRSRKSKKPILKPSLPAVEVRPQPIVVPQNPLTTVVNEPNPIAQRMAEITEELKEPELPEPKKEFMLPAAEPPTPPPNLPIG